MYPVSNGWTNAHLQTLLPETFLEIVYDATEPGAQFAATSTGTGEAPFSETSGVASSREKFPERYATLEGFGLDEKYTYFDETPVDPGYVTDSLSGADGTFSVHPVITITMDAVRTGLLPGITITWSEEYREWASDFIVTAWADGLTVAQTTVTGNVDPVSKVTLEMQSYNRITIEVLRWSLPYHRVRCSEVFLGIRTVYTKRDLMGFTHTQTADLLSAALPKNEITFKLRNDDERWNPDNPSGTERYLTSRQEVRVRYGMDVNGAVEWIPGGTFWLTGWVTPANGLEASFTARDVLAFMDEVYTGPKSGTLRDIILAAFEQANIPTRNDGSPRYLVDASLADYTTDFTMDYTMAQVVQMAAHAGNCTIRQDRDGVMRVEPWVQAYDGYIIDPWISYRNPEYVINKALRSVSVGYGATQARVSVPTTLGVGEVQTVDNPFLRTADDARRVGKHTGEMLRNNKVISGEFRADVRLDALDNIVVTSKYASNVIAVTDVSYSTTGGTFRGRYTGRVVSIDLKPADRRVGELYAGEV